MAKSKATATANTPDAAPAEETPIEQRVRLVKLADPTTSFVDPETDFRLVGDEVKELPEDAGKLTLQWLRAGGLVDADAPELKEAAEGDKSGTN